MSDKLKAETRNHYLTVKEAAQYLRVSPQTLDKLRHYGGGPEFIRIGARTIRYDRAALDAWMNARRASAVADYREAAA